MYQMYLPVNIAISVNISVAIIHTGETDRNVSGTVFRLCFVVFLFGNSMFSISFCPLFWIIESVRLIRSDALFSLMSELIMVTAFVFSFSLFKFWVF